MKIHVLYEVCTYDLCMLMIFDYFFPSCSSSDSDSSILWSGSGMSDVLERIPFLGLEE